ncbi:MAG: nucleotidyltransferase family protein [Gammaproteobacteria bacterium]|nr:nucleotidyltransferase family protein [Gammaproteobacteria bacterium]
MKKLNCWPREDQELLLKAALSKFPEAIIAWTNYLATHDLDHIEHACIHLLPLVYMNIQQNHVCKSVYRYWWASNHLFLNRFKQLLQTLIEQNIEPCLLKGGALMLCCYSSPGARVIGDIDILIDKSQVKKTIERLMSLGWQPSFEMENLEDYMKIKHGCHFTNQHNQCVDLHWLLSLRHVTNTSLAQVSYKTVRHFTEKLGREVVMLCPEDQLLHIFIHGIAESEQPLIRWVPDAAFILRHHTLFDWDYFFQQTKNAKISFIVKPALEYLHEKNFIILSKRTLKSLGKLKDPWSEIFSASFSRTKIVHTIRFVRLTWKEYRQKTPACCWVLALLRLPKYLSQRWRCENKVGFFRKLQKKFFKHLLGK